MSRALVLAVVIAGGCGPSSWDDFRQQLAKRACDRAIRCGQIGSSERQYCDAPTAILAITGNVGPLPVEEPDIAVKNQRMRFFSDAAEDCLDAVDGAPCDDVALLWRVQQRCHHVLEPGATRGQACYPGECEGGRCTGAQGACMGMCSSFPPPGSPCDPSDPFGCDPTVQWCDGSCEPKKPLGSACNADVECAWGYSCQQNVCGDPPTFTAGDQCPVINRLCSDELYCSSSNICTPFVEQGGSCDVDVACKPGLACVGLERPKPGMPPTASGTCQPWADTTQTCTAASVSGCPATQQCEGSCAAPPATRKVNAGEVCMTDDDCSDGLYCGYQTCRWRVGLGGSCSPGPSACLPALMCNVADFTCVATAVACGL